MPIIKSAIKRVRQQAKRRSRNLQVKRAIHQDTRALEAAVASGDSAETAAALKAVVSQIDRAVKKGTLHKNTASRRKSSLTKQAYAVTGPATASSAPKKTTTKKTPAKATASKTKPATKTTKKAA